MYNYVYTYIYSYLQYHGQSPYLYAGRNIRMFLFGLCCSEIQPLKNGISSEHFNSVNHCAAQVVTTTAPHDCHVQP